MKMLPCAIFGVLLAASCTDVMVGTGVPPPPVPVITVPSPLKLIEMPLTPKDPVPARLGKLPPVTPPEYVPPETVAEPLIWPPVAAAAIADAGMLSAPVIVPDPPPPVSVMVNAPL